MNESIYDKCQRCLLYIPEIVLLFRRQCYFKGTKQLQLLTAEVRSVAEWLLQQGQYIIEYREFMEILEVFVMAQESRDYILMADLLECDLCPLLQRLQMSLDRGVFPTYWEENLRCLEPLDFRLCEQLTEKEILERKYYLAAAVDGSPVLKAIVGGKEFWMHSSVNPKWEAELLAESMSEEKKDRYYVFGMGMGYHVQAILDSNVENLVTVLESEVDVLCLSLRYMKWASYFSSGRLKIIYNPDVGALISEMGKESEDYSFFIHYPSLQCVEDMDVKESMEDHFVKTSTMREQGKLLDQNFARLQRMQLPECSEIKDIFCGKSCVLVGGGPSVDQELEELQEYRSQISLIAVGTIARRLLGKGIIPDVIVMTDPEDHMYEQIQELNTKEIPLILLSTASADIVAHYEGEIYLAYQSDYEPAERKAEEKGYILFATGGSVSTLTLDIAIRFGAEKIILVGMDMAFTGDQSHAAGIGYRVEAQSDLRMVVNTEGEKIFTSRNLDIYRKWIERRLSGLENLIVYNTGKGARIAGTYELGIKEALQR